MATLCVRIVRQDGAKIQVLSENSPWSAVGVVIGSEVSCQLRNAEYNPRKGLRRMQLRLLKPAADATVWSKGNVQCWVKARGGNSQ